MITLKVRGQTCRTEAFLRKYSTLDVKNLDEYGVKGVNALANATPMDTGVTANSWEYKIVKEDGKERLVFTNSNVVDGDVNIAAILQYGHVTNNGGYVEGIDYINPALTDIFNEVADKQWEEIAKDSVEKFDTFLDTFPDALTDKLTNISYTISMAQMIPGVSAKMAELPTTGTAHGTVKNPFQGDTSAFTPTTGEKFSAWKANAKDTASNAATKIKNLVRK